MLRSRDGGRDFRLLWWAGVGTTLGSQLTALALPLYVLQATGSPTAAGVLAAVAVASLLVSALPGGAVADGFERRRVLLTCTSLSVVLSATLAALVSGSAPAPLSALIGVTAGLGILASVSGPAVSALVVTAVPADRLGAATAKLQSRTAALRLVGPLLGGMLYGVAAWLPFVVQTAGVLVALGCTLGLRRTPASTAADRRWWGGGEMTAGLRFLWSRPELRVPLLLFGCGLNTAFGAAVLAALAVTAEADPSGRLSGLMSALAGAGSLLGGLAAARLPVQSRIRAALLAAMAAAGSALLLLAVTPAPLVGVVLLGCMAVAAVATVAFTTLLMQRTDPRLLGRVAAAAGVVSMLAQPAGPLLGGLLYERAGATATFVVLGLTCLCCLVIAARSSALRRLAVTPVVTTRREVAHSL